MNTRNYFHIRVGVGTLKYVAGCDHHRRRNSVMNKELVSSKCPRCSEGEDWQHILTCQSINHFKNQHAIDLKLKLGKVSKEEKDRC